MRRDRFVMIIAAVLICLCYANTEAWYPVDLYYEFADPLRFVPSSSVSRVLYGTITKIDLSNKRIQLVTDAETIWGKLSDDAIMLHNGQPCSISTLAPVPGGFEQWGLACLDQRGVVVYIEGIYPLFAVEMVGYDPNRHTVAITLADEPTVTYELAVCAPLWEKILVHWSDPVVFDVYLDWNGKVTWISDCE